MPQTLINFSQLSKTWKMAIGGGLTLLAVGGTVLTLRTENYAGEATRQEYSDGTSTQSGSLTVGSGARKNVLFNDGRVMFNNVEYTFPFSDGSASGKALQTDGNGNLSWSTVSAGGQSVDTGAIVLAGDDRFVNVSGDTMTGNLLVKAALSGATLWMNGGPCDTLDVDAAGQIVCGTDAQLTQEQVEDFAGGMVTGNTETLITVTYQDGDGTIDFEVEPNLSNYTNDAGFITGPAYSFSEIDSWMLNDNGDTSTGKLTINLTSGEDALEVMQTISGARIHSQNRLSSSGGLAVSSTGNVRTVSATGYGNGPVLWLTGYGTGQYLITGISRSEDINAIDIAHNPNHPTLDTTKTFSLANNINARGDLMLLTNNGSGKTLLVDHDDRNDWAQVITSEGRGLKIVPTTGYLGLNVAGISSGWTIHAQDELTSSGKLIVESNTNRAELIVDNTASDGDSIINLRFPGVAQWLMGMDDGDSDKLKFDFASSLTTTPEMMITSAGDMGIGTNTPDGRLHLDAGTSNTSLILEKDAGTVAGLRFHNAGSETASITYDSLENIVVENEVDGQDIVFNIFDDPDTVEMMRIYSNGNAVSIGQNVGENGQITRNGQALQVLTEDNWGGAVIATYSATDAHDSILDLAKSGNGTLGAHGALAAEENLGILVFRGSDATNFETAASIRGQVDGAPGNDDMPGRITFYTTPDNSNTALERMRLTSTGNLAIGTTLAKARLAVATSNIGSGAVYIDQNANATGVLVESIASGAPTLALDNVEQFPSGSAQAPHLLFGYTGTFDTNLYRAGPNLLATDDQFWAKLGFRSSGSLIVEAGNTVSINGVTYNFPPSDGSSSGKVLHTDGAGNLSWSTDDGAGGDTFANILIDGVDVSTDAPTLDFSGTGFLIVENSTDIFDVQLDQDVIFNTEIDTLAELETIMSGINIIASTEIDTYSELNAIVADVTLTHNGLIDTFSELNTIVADKTLVNEEDAVTWESAHTFSENVRFNKTASGAGIYGATLSGGLLYGFGLTDCDNATTSKLLWDATTRQFSCGTDQSSAGLTYAEGSSYFVDDSGDTMTGALVIRPPSFGLGLNVAGGMSGRSLIVAGTGTNTLFFANGGKVGIGTQTVTGSNLVQIGGYGVSTQMTMNKWEMKDDNSNVSFRNNNNGAFLFYNHVGASSTTLGMRFHVTTSDSAAMDILNNRDVRFYGNIGVNTGTPTTDIEVVGTMSGTNIAGVARNLTWFISGTVATGTEQGPTIRLDEAMYCYDVTMHAKTAPTGATLIVDINDGGGSIFSTRPEIDISGTTEDNNHVFSDTSFSAGTEITLDVDQIGSTIAGADLTVQLHCKSRP